MKLARFDIIMLAVAASVSALLLLAWGLIWLLPDEEVIAPQLRFVVTERERMSSGETSYAAYLQGSLKDLAISENSDIDIRAVTMRDTKATVWVDERPSEQDMSSAETWVPAWLDEVPPPRAYTQLEFRDHETGASYGVRPKDSLEW